MVNLIKDLEEFKRYFYRLGKKDYIKRCNRIIQYINKVQEVKDND